MRPAPTGICCERAVDGCAVRGAPQPRPPAPGERDERFVTWWCAEVQQYAFGALRITRAEDLLEIGPLRAQLERNRTVLDRIEEEFIDRFAAV